MANEPITADKRTCNRCGVPMTRQDELYVGVNEDSPTGHHSSYTCLMNLQACTAELKRENADLHQRLSGNGMTHDTRPTHEPKVEYAAPIARLMVTDDESREECVTASLYSPGLPPGEYDLYLEANHVQYGKQFETNPAESKAQPLYLTGWEAKQIVEFCGGEYDVDLAVAKYEARKCEETGEDMPAGLYVWCAEYPGEGQMLCTGIPPKQAPAPTPWQFLVAAGRHLLNAIDTQHDKEPPLKYSIPYDAVNTFRAAMKHFEDIVTGVPSETKPAELRAPQLSPEMRMFQSAVASLAAIDDALGLPQDGCNEPEQTIDAIEQLKSKWRCFHCDEVFNDHASALEHFGPSQYTAAACQVDIAEYRRMEEVHRSHCEEDTDADRAIHSLRSDMNIAVKRAEEDGYAKGLLDAPVGTADSLFQCIKHGDEAHQQWLRAELEMWFAQRAAFRNSSETKAFQNCGECDALLGCQVFQECQKAKTEAGG